jgi:hypothetical protein
MIPIRGKATPRSRRIARLPRFLAVFVLAIATTPVGALGSDELPGQVPPWLRPQTSIRLTMIDRGDRGPILGEFRTARGDSIWISPRQAGREVALPLPEVARFEVSREQSPRTWSGAGIGFLAGAIIGAALGAKEGSEQGDTGARIAVDGIAVGCLGMALGALVGHSVRDDHWTTIWSRDVRSPQREGSLGLGAAAAGAPDQEGATR